MSVTWDARIAQPDEATTKSRLQTVFELELRKHGVIVSAGATNYLELALTLLYNEAGTVSYTYDLNLHEPGLPDRAVLELFVKAFPTSDSALLRRLRSPDSVRAARELRARMWEGFTASYWARQTTWVTTWNGPTGVAHVGRLNLRQGLESRALESAQAFANKWMASRRQ